MITTIVPLQFRHYVVISLAYVVTCHTIVGREHFPKLTWHKVSLGKLHTFIGYCNIHHKTIMAQRSSSLSSLILIHYQLMTHDSTLFSKYSHCLEQLYTSFDYQKLMCIIRDISVFKIRRIAKPIEVNGFVLYVTWNRCHHL
jgi:hypothetical protein